MANSLHQVGRPQIEVADPIALGDARDLPDGSVRAWVLRCAAR